MVSFLKKDGDIQTLSNTRKIQTNQVMIMSEISTNPFMIPINNIYFIKNLRFLNIAVFNLNRRPIPQDTMIKGYSILWGLVPFFIFYYGFGKDNIMR
jgi:hypothetical protein